MNPRRRPRRSARWIVAVLLAALGGTAVVATPTRAAWTDAEWVTSAVGVRVPRDCITPGRFRAEGGGRFLGGSLLGQNLDTLASVGGLTATNTGISSSAVPTAPATAPDTYANPLSASALTAVNAALGNGLQLNVPAGQAGAYQQWGRAPNTGQSAGASGLVNNSGAIGLTGTPADAGLPAAAHLSLGTLLPTVAALADADLVVGAVGSSTVLDQCATLEARVHDPGAAAVVDRRYAIAGLDLFTDSPVVAATRTAVAGAVTTAAGAVTDLAGPNGLIAQTLKNGVTGALNGATGALGLGSVTAAVSVGLDLAPVNALVGKRLDDGVVVIDLTNGTVEVDLAALLNGSNGLNNLAPNTDLVVDTAVITELNRRVGVLLNDWTAGVQAATAAAIDAAVVSAVVDVKLRGSVPLVGVVDVANVRVTLNDTMGRILAGRATLGVATQLLVPAVGTLVNPILATIVSTTLGATTLAAILSTLRGVLSPVVSTALSSLRSSLTAAQVPLTTLLGVIGATLGQVLAITVNSQSDQVVVTSRRYQAAALRLTVLAGAGTAASVTLARSWAGPITEVS